MLFQIDEDEERRHELVEEAVQAFAPQLEGKPGVKAIHLYSTNDSLRRLFRELFGGSKTILVEHCLDKGKPRRGVNEVPQRGIFLKLPSEADLVVTKTNLTSKMEWFAAGLGAQVCIIPESIPYVFERLSKVPALVLVGAETGKK